MPRAWSPWIIIGNKSELKTVYKINLIKFAIKCLGEKQFFFWSTENAMVIITTITAKKFFLFHPPPLAKKYLERKKKSSRFRGGWVYFPKLHQTPAFCCNVTYTFREGGFNRSTHWTTFWTKFKLLPLQCTVVNISAFPLKVPFPCLHHPLH